MPLTLTVHRRESDAGVRATCNLADAFGLLPGARAAHGAYLEKAEEALRGLRAVQVTLTADLAGGLRTTAANYVAADEDSIPRSP